MTTPGNKKPRAACPGNVAGHEVTSVKNYTLDPRNARRYPERNISAVAASLGELGAGRSIVVDREGVVIGGNAVYEKARTRHPRPGNRNEGRRASRRATGRSALRGPGDRVRDDGVKGM